MIRVLPHFKYNLRENIFKSKFYSGIHIIIFKIFFNLSDYFGENFKPDLYLKKKKFKISIYIF